MLKGVKTGGIVVLALLAAFLAMPGLATAQITAGTVNVKNLLNAQNSATAGEFQVLSAGAVTTAAPSYTNGNSSPLSLDTTGNLRVNCIAGCSAPTIPTLTGNSQQAVTTSAVALGTNTSKSVCLKVIAASTSDPIYFGISTVTASGATGGMELSVRDGWCGAIANTNQIFVIAGPGGAGSTVAYNWTN